MKKRHLIVAAGAALLGGCMWSGPVSVGTQGGDAGATVSFADTIVGVGMGGRVTVTRSDGTTVLPLDPAATRVSLDDDLGEIGSIAADADGRLLIDVRGESSGSTTLRLHTGDGIDEIDAETPLQFVIADEVSVDCAPGPSLADGVLVGDEALCRTTAHGAGAVLGHPLPVLEAGLETSSGDAAAPLPDGDGWFRVTATAPGKTAIGVAAGPVAWRIPVDVVGESEIASLEFVDAATHEPVGDVLNGTPELTVAVGATLTVWPRVATDDGRHALGLDQRFRTDGGTIVDGRAGVAGITLRGLEPGQASLAADICDRHWDVPVTVESK